MWTRPGVAPFRPDSVIFDVDGVLVDSRASMLETDMRTVQWVFTRLYGLQDSGPLLTLDDILAFKRVGGWNDDWDLCYGLCAIFLSHRGKAEDTRALREQCPPLAGIAAQTGGKGLDRLFAFVPRPTLAFDVVVRVYNEHHFGIEHYEASFGEPPRYFTGEGLIKHEVALIEESVLDRLRASGATKWGLVTGRTEPELKFTLARLPFDEAFVPGSIVTFPTYKKPDPAALDHVVRALGTHAGLYVGDAPDDVLLVRNYRAAFAARGTAFLSVTVVALELADHYQRLGTDATIEHISELPDLIYRLREAVGFQTRSAPEYRPA